MGCTRISLAAALVFGAFACGDDGGVVTSDAGPNRDAAAGVDATFNDATPSLAWVDFTVTGCASGSAQLGGGDSDAGVPDPCVGAAPLTLQFTAIAPGTIALYRWSFEELKITDPTPVYTFRLPGTYDVALTVGGPGGTAMVTKPGIVVVNAAPLGNRCADDAQCETGECICDDQTSCDAGLAFGMCSKTCSDSASCDGGVCANLAPGGAGIQDWQQQLCVASCNDDTDCPGSLRCRQLLDESASWVKGCFAADLLGDIGASCHDAGGNPDGNLCTTGQCLNEGSRGVCSVPCTMGGCPSGSACATFNVNPAGAWCVARCDTPGVCDTDAWLACEAPGNPGSKGFSVDEVVGGATYCAPKVCTGPGECGTDGACVDGFCAAALP